MTSVAGAHEWPSAPELESTSHILDAEDPLRGYRDRFFVPARPDGSPVHYFCGNSLGLQPRGAREIVEQEFDDWRDMAVGAHFEGKTPWFSYHEVFRDAGARLVGAQPGEVVMMNSLTVNLHLMMVSFYRPTPERFKILVENTAFPSDTYAVRSQVEVHGHDPDEGVMVLKPRDGESTLRTEDILATIEEHGDEIALVMLGGVNYFTGQAFEMERITEAGHRKGCRVGFDLAHGAGNLHLQLHDWNVDFAVWCNYKYINSGPGSIAGCFVHERHGKDPSIPRFAGWWGNDPDERFKMHLLETFEPCQGADGWQLSNPPILAMAPLQASLEIFDEVGMAALRKKSERLTAYLETLVDMIPGDRCEILTPRDPGQRGCQLSIRFRSDADTLRDELEAAGVICDLRKPDVVRVAPVPLYNTYNDVWCFAGTLRNVLSGSDG